MSTKRIGDEGEDVAAAYLEAQGLVVLERQYRFERAEVDLVCFEPATAYERGGELVFVEVKTRTGLGYGRPEEAVTEAKQRQVIRAAQAYLHERRLEGSPCRFDVVGVLLKGEAEPEVEHFRDAFRIWF